MIVLPEIVLDNASCCVIKIHCARDGVRAIIPATRTRSVRSDASRQGVAVFSPLFLLEFLMHAKSQAIKTRKLMEKFQNLIYYIREGFNKSI